jgi:MFS family permease
MRTTGRVLAGISVLWVPLAFLVDGVTVLVLPVRLGDHGDAGTLGMVSFVGLAAGVAFQPLAGWLSDRLRSRADRRLFLSATAVPVVVGIWLLAGTSGTLSAAAGYVVMQAAAGAMQGGQGALIPEHVPAAMRGRAAGIKSAFDVGGAFVGFLVLGALVASGDVAATGVLLTLVVLAAVALVWLLVPPVDAGRRSASLQRAAAGWPPGFTALVLSRFLFLFGTYAVGRFLLLLVADRLGLAPVRAAAEAGWLLALFTAATALAAIPFGWLADRHGRHDLMRLGAVVSAVGIAAFIPPLGLPGVVAAGLLMAIGTAAFVSANWAAATDVVAPATAGRLMGVVGVATGVAAAAAGLLGPLIDAVGFAPALALAAVVAGTALLPLAGAHPASIHLLKEHQ